VHKTVVPMVVACALVVPATAVAGPYFNDPFDRAGPIERHDPRPIWLSKLMEGGGGQASEPQADSPSLEHQRKGEDHHTHTHTHRHHDEGGHETDEGLAPSAYEEDLARDNAREYTEEDKEDDTQVTHSIRCASYRVAYMMRHAHHTPTSLKDDRGCNRWSNDYYYHERLNEL
jgi:hypothetical protein